MVQVEEREMKWNVRHLKYQEELMKEEVRLVVEKLNKLQLCLDKLSFTNIAYKTTSCLSAGELDKQVIDTKISSFLRLNLISNSLDLLFICS